MQENMDAAIIREEWCYQIGWIFRKNSQRHFFSENIRKKPFIKIQNLQHKILDWKWPPTPPLELFRKFIWFGSANFGYLISLGGHDESCRPERLLSGKLARLILHIVCWSLDRFQPCFFVPQENIILKLARLLKTYFNLRF